MAELQYEIYELGPKGLTGFESIVEREIDLIDSTKIRRTFKAYNNFIELSYFNLDNVRLQTEPVYTRYSVLSGDTIQNQEGNTEISINVLEDYKQSGYNGTDIKLLYNFLDYPYSSTINPEEFFIDSISADRQELRLKALDAQNSDIERITDDLVERYEAGDYLPDLHLYFGNNIFFTIINIGKELDSNTGDVNVLIKLYQPLPSSVSERALLNVVEKIGNSAAFEINATIIPEPLKPLYLRSANYDIEVENESTEPSKYFNFDELFSFPTNNTYRELNSLFNEKGAELGIDYSDFSNFINFSSAEERLRNFKYKLDLIESHQNNLDILNSTNYSGSGAESSSTFYKNLIDGIINNFDHYERHLYFDNKPTSWPKTNSTKPFINALSSTPEATNFFNSEIEDAILFDNQNNDTLIESIPSFLREDSNNRPYELFVHMIAQHFDNIWIYTNKVSEKYNADNRLNIGVSKDLVEELLKNFGVKLYTSTKSTEDLYKYFSFNSYDVSEEYLPDGIIGSGKESISQNNYQKEIYKRIYHNLPLLMKSKGTERGLRALINCFGIPSEVLKIKLYGGQSYENLPYFGGEQEYTGSIDKVRLDNTGSIVPGNTISYFTSINIHDGKYTQDLHRIEVGFSPSDNINAYIVSQSQELFPNDPINIDQFIGDPRENTSNRYESLFQFSKTVLANVDEYRLKDFIRLIKFFDNVIFRMVKDFTPARSVTDSGIIIKPHLLERNKVLNSKMTWIRPEYSGSIDTAFISGSHGSIFDSGSSERSTAYSSSYMTPTGRAFKFWTKPDGSKLHEKSLEEAKFDGELSGSKLLITTGEMNDENNFKEITYSDVKYNLRFFKEVPEGSCVITGNTIIVRDENQDFIENIGVTELFNDITGNYNFSSDSNVVFDNTGGQDDVATITFNEQYEEVTITAENPSIDSDTDSPGIQPCTADSRVILVRCNASVNEGAGIIQAGVPFDLNTLFLPGDNTDYSIIVNENPLSPGQAESFTFNDTDETIPQAIVFQDNIDETCQVEFVTTVDSCPLTTPVSNNQNWTVFNRDKYPELPSQEGWYGDEFFNLREIFPGSNENTQYQIKFSGQGFQQDSEWLTVQTYTISGNNIQRQPGPESSYFPTNYARLAEDYSWFNQNYAQDSGQGGFGFGQDWSINLPVFEIYFRAVQNNSCVVGYTEDGQSQSQNVVWNPYQDQVGIEEWQGPIAAKKLYPIDFYRNLGASEPEFTTEQNEQGEPFGWFEQDVCSPTDQSGQLNSSVQKSVLYTTIRPDLQILNAAQAAGLNTGATNYPQWDTTNNSWGLGGTGGQGFGSLGLNNGVHRAAQKHIIQSNAPLFEDSRGFNPASKGVYTSYAPRPDDPTVAGEQINSGQQFGWAWYDYFYRPNPPSDQTSADPFVVHKSWVSFYSEGNLPGGQTCHNQDP